LRNQFYNLCILQKHAIDTQTKVSLNKKMRILLIWLDFDTHDCSQLQS